MSTFVAQENLLGGIPNITSLERREACLQWVAATGSDVYGPAGRAIIENLRWFRQSEPLHDIYTAVVALFAAPDATVEEMPRMVEALLSQSDRDSKTSLELWEPPKQLNERRKAVSVWSSMLAVLVAHWKRDSELLEKMGLDLSEEMKSKLDEIAYWCEIEGNAGRVQSAAREVFVKALRDPDPSPKRNPILWWLLVLIQSQVLEKTPELPLGGPDKGFVPNLSFDGKLQALHHYARILTLESLVHGCEPSDTTNPDFAGHFSGTENEILAIFHNEGTHWMDEDNDRLLQRLFHKKSHEDSLTWQHSLNELHSLVDAWLVHDCYGPVREILGLMEGVAARRGDERQQDLVCSAAQPPSQPEADRYRVFFQIWAHYTQSRGGHGMTRGRLKASRVRHLGVYKSAEEANEEARRVPAVTFGPSSNARRWNEHIRDDGAVKIWAVYIHRGTKARVVAWVEKQLPRATAPGDP